jgi:hypothetical protein
MNITANNEQLPALYSPDETQDHDVDDEPETPRPTLCLVSDEDEVARRQALNAAMFDWYYA